VESGKHFNIFPQNGAVNNGEMKARELRIRKAFGNGSRICLDIQLKYSRKDKEYDIKRPGRPGSLTYDVWVNGSKNPGKFSNPVIQNPQ